MRNQDQRIQRDGSNSSNRNNMMSMNRSSNHGVSLKSRGMNGGVPLGQGRSRFPGAPGGGGGGGGPIMDSIVQNSRYVVKNRNIMNSNDRNR